MSDLTFPAIQIQQHGRQCVVSALPASVLTAISYAATRGESNQPNAVQRVLRQDRVEGIKDFLLKGGYFPGSIVLNWDSTSGAFNFHDSKIFIKSDVIAAQIIDGQHRVEGLREAISDSSNRFNNFFVPVTIFQDLDLKESADIFLSINTMQRPVPTSLVHDLFGVASESIIDYATVRARDIAEFLNTEEISPYFEEIKFPGSRRRRGGISLSAAVSAIKPLVEKNGLFEQSGISDFRQQAQILINFFEVIKSKYGVHWGSVNDVFYYSSGFSGALEFFEKRMLPYCITKNSFKPYVISRVLSLDGKDLIYQEEVKKMSGKDAAKKVADRLNSYFKPESSSTGIEI